MAHLITEDDTPVDNRHSERQQHLLPTILYASWPEGKPFEALSNVGLFHSIAEQAVVPDFMLSVGVKPRPVSDKKVDKSYFTWIYGKPPDLVVEEVSNRKCGELSRKKALYAKIGVPYYVVFDPFLKLGRPNRKRELRTFVLTGGRYTEATSAHWFPLIGLGLTVWTGSVGDLDGRWLRFIDIDGKLLPTSEESAERAKAKAKNAEARIEQAEARIEQAEAKVEQAEAKVEQAEAKVEQAEAKVEQAEAKVGLAETKAERAEAGLRVAQGRAQEAEREVARLMAELEALRRERPDP